MPTPPPRIGLQLYTVRDAFGDDPEGTLARIAEIGYAGVEPFPEAFEALPAARLRERCDALGLHLPASHLPLPLGANREPVLATARTLGLTWVVATLGADAFSDAERVAATAEAFASAAANAREAGFRFAIHNHWWEFEGGEHAPYKALRAALPADVDFEIDCYWVRVAGLDPAAVLRALAGRTPLLHLKDGPATYDDPMVALGDGAMDLPAALAAASDPAWLMVELDACEGDPMDAAARSFRFLADNGFGHGR